MKNLTPDDFKILWRVEYHTYNYKLKIFENVVSNFIEDLLDEAYIRDYTERFPKLGYRETPISLKKKIIIKVAIPKRKWFKKYTSWHTMFQCISDEMHNKHANDYLLPIRFENKQEAECLIGIICNKTMHLQLKNNVLITPRQVENYLFHHPLSH